jgi:hypothetical protein
MITNNGFLRYCLFFPLREKCSFSFEIVKLPLQTSLRHTAYSNILQFWGRRDEVQGKGWRKLKNSSGKCKKKEGRADGKTDTDGQSGEPLTTALNPLSGKMIASLTCRKSWMYSGLSVLKSPPAIFLFFGR